MKKYFLILFAMLALLLSGCDKAESPQEEISNAGLAMEAEAVAYAAPDPDAIAATAGQQSVTVGQLQAWYWAVVSQFQQGSQELAPDFSRPLDQQPYSKDGSKTWQDYFLQQALTAWHTSAALVQQSQEEAIPTEAEYQPDLEKHDIYLVDIPAVRYLYGYSQYYQPNSMHQSFLDGIPELLEALARERGYEDPEDMAQRAFGSSLEDLIACVWNYNYGYMYFTTLGYDLDSGTFDLAETPDSDSQQERYVDIRLIQLVPEDLLETLTPYEKYHNVQPEVLEYAQVLEDGRVLCSEDAWARCEDKGWSLLKTWKNMTYTTEATFAQLAAEQSQDAGTALDGGALHRITQGQLLPALDSWCFDSSREVGDTTVIRTEYGCYVLYFAGSTEISQIEKAQSQLTRQHQEILSAVREKYPMEVTDAVSVLAGAEGGIPASDLLYPDVAHERYPEIPLYLQQDYPHTSFGDYGIMKNGCGITSFAMLASYMADEEWTPPELCAKYGQYSGPNGTDGMIFIHESPVLGFYFKEKTHDVEKAHKYLEDGYIVISLQQSGYWTSSGHYIVLESMNEDGLVQVRDSNLYNYGKIEAHKEDLHSWGSIRNRCIGYWVFEKKATSIPACTRCGTGDNLTVQNYTCHKCQEALLRRNIYLTVS